MLKTHNTAQLILVRTSLYSIWLFLLIFSGLSQAEIYKWVDDQGRTHYSDQKTEAKSQQIEKLELKRSMNLMQPKPTIKPKPSTFTASKPTQTTTHQSKTKTQTKPDLYREEPGVDPRCTLARKILTGEARLRNGLRTGKREIEVAKRDIERFCKP